MANVSPSVRPAGSGIAQGSVVGGRFEIERAVGDDALGALLAATDQKTGRRVTVRVLSPGLIATREAIDRLKVSVRQAAAVQHRNVLGIYGMGKDKDSGSRYVATEWVDGTDLAAVVEAKRADDAQPMSLRGTYNVVAHVCRALMAAQEKGISHGALRPSTVLVTAAGRVKVGNFGLDRAVIEIAGSSALGASEQAYLAPEVKAGGAPDARSDVFGLGALLYAMLTGRGASDDFVPPSHVHPEASERADAVLLKCLSADPAARFADPGEVKDALVQLTAEAGASQDEEDFGVDIDIDIDIGSVAPPPGSLTEAVEVPRASAVPEEALASGPAAGASGVVVASADRASAPSPEASASARASQPGPRRLSAPGQGDVDLGALLEKIAENDAPRWMVVKDNLDHGPFTGREMVQEILKGEVLGSHSLLNMDTGERGTVGEAPEFVEFVAQWELKKKDLDHKVALEVSEKREKMTNATKIVGVVGLSLLMIAGVVVYIATRPDARRTTRSDQQLAELYEAGEIEITGSAGLLPDPEPSRSGRGRRGARRGGRGGGAGMSYEDAMNQVVDLGSANGTGSQARLSSAQVAGVMNQSIGRLVPCLSQGSGGGTVRVDMAILGSGRIAGVSVRNGTPGFQRCVASAVRGVRFPTFPAARMGASYSFSAN